MICMYYIFFNFNVWFQFCLVTHGIILDIKKNISIKKSVLLINSFFNPKIMTFLLIVNICNKCWVFANQIPKVFLFGPSDFCPRRLKVQLCPKKMFKINFEKCYYVVLHWWLLRNLNLQCSVDFKKLLSTFLLIRTGG